MSNDHHSGSDGVRFARFLIRNRVVLLTTLIIAIAATVFVTLRMEPQYRSTGIIFPTPTNSPEKILVDPQFGYEVDADWLMQVLKSDIVRDTLNKSFDLVTYFGIDTGEAGWIDEYRSKYNEMMGFERTRYMSIEISATTADPELSAAIVNTLIDKINPIRESIFKENTLQSLLHYEQAYFSKKDRVKSLVDSIYNLREYNTSASLRMLYEQVKTKSDEVDACREELDEMRSRYNFYDLGNYIQSLSANLAAARSNYSSEKGKYDVYKANLAEKDSLLLITRARMEGALSEIEGLEAEIESFDTIKKRYEEVTAKLRASIEQLNRLNEQYENTANAFEPFVNSIRLERLASDYAHEQVLLNDLRYRYENALQNYNNPIPSVYVINRAEPSYKKVSPSLMKNGLIIILASMAFVLGLLIVIEKMRSLKSALRGPAG